MGAEEFIPLPASRWRADQDTIEKMRQARKNEAAMVAANIQNNLKATGDRDGVVHARARTCRRAPDLHDLRCKPCLGTGKCGFRRRSPEGLSSLTSICSSDRSRPILICRAVRPFSRLLQDTNVDGQRQLHAGDADRTMRSAARDDSAQRTSDPAGHHRSGRTCRRIIDTARIEFRLCGHRHAIVGRHVD